MMNLRPTSLEEVTTLNPARPAPTIAATTTRGRALDPAVTEARAEVARTGTRSNYDSRPETRARFQPDRRHGRLLRYRGPRRRAPSATSTTTPDFEILRLVTT